MGAAPRLATLFLLLALPVLAVVAGAATTIEHAKVSTYVGGENELRILSNYSMVYVRVVDAAGIKYYDGMLYLDENPTSTTYPYAGSITWTWEMTTSGYYVTIYDPEGNILYSAYFEQQVNEGEVAGNPVWRALKAVGSAVAAALKWVFSRVADKILGLLPDWLEAVIRSAWTIVGDFAPPLFELVAELFKVYPFIFMMMSLKYVVTGDVEGWINYVWYHVKIIRVFIDLGFKIIEAVTP